MTRRKLVVLLSVLTNFNCAAAISSDQWDRFTDVGAVGLTTAALAVPCYQVDREGFNQSLYSVVSSVSMGLLSKSLIKKERPDGSGNDSFPSNHTAVAFSSATTLYSRYGWKTGAPAYAIAIVVGIGRVQADKHDWSDVFAGGLIGTAAGWVFTDKINDNVQILPWVTEKHGAGLSAIVTW